MSRLPRINIESALYYITTKSGHSYNIFIDDMDYKEYISLVAKYKNQYGFKLFSYSLLPARLEMLIELKNDANISNIMHDITSLYTKTYNGKYGRKGHLFQQRFKSQIAEKDAYLLQLTRQIHLSPVVEKLAAEPKAYPYSSHNMFLDPSKRVFPNMKPEIEEVLKRFKGREKEFDGFVSGPDPKETEELKKILRRNRILGSSEFIEEVKRKIEENVKLQKKNQASKKVQMIYVAAGSAAILALAIGVTYFYKQNYALKSEYIKTVNLYKSTLEILKRERDMAIKTDKGAENYAWKIRLTEQALEKTVQENKRAEILKKGIDGLMWRIALSQVSGTPIEFQKEDVIYFDNNLYLSNNLSKVGFPSTVYTKTDLKNGIIIWKTVQSNDRYETVNWRGEWNGNKIKGVMSFRSPNGEVRDFSFVSVGESIKK